MEYACLATNFSRTVLYSRMVKYAVFSIIFKSAYIDIFIVLLPHFYMGWYYSLK